MSTDSSVPTVIPVGPERAADVGDAIGAAFQLDPVFMWLFPQARERPTALPRFFTLEGRALVLRHGVSVAALDGTGGLAGAALVLPPGHWRMPLLTQAWHAPAFVRVFGPRLPRAMRLLAAVEAAHPREPHVYVGYIGVRPEAQGLGVGAALLAPVLERCDDEGLPAYLEASNPRAVPFYRRLGFVTGRVLRHAGAPPLELMTRPPRRPERARSSRL